MLLGSEAVAQLRLALRAMLLVCLALGGLSALLFGNTLLLSSFLRLGGFPIALGFLALLALCLGFLLRLALLTRLVRLPLDFLLLLLLSLALLLGSLPLGLLLLRTLFFGLFLQGLL